MRRSIFIVALVFALVAACQEHRGFDIDASIYKIPNQDKAMLLLERNVEDNYNVRLGNTFETSQVYFVRGVTCPYNGAAPAIILEDGSCVHGIMWNCQEMYVAVTPLDDPLDYRVCGTALLHEFGHCLLQAMDMPADITHENSELWDIVQKTNKDTCSRGW